MDDYVTVFHCSMMYKVTVHDNLKRLATIVDGQENPLTIVRIKEKK